MKGKSIEHLPQAGGTIDAQFSGSNPVKRDGPVREPRGNDEGGGGTRGLIEQLRPRPVIQGVEITVPKETFTARCQRACLA